jgi:cytochrome c-type biogenesis protein CcmH
MIQAKQGSISFLKKRNKELLFVWLTRQLRSARTVTSKSSLVLSFKKELLPFCLALFLASPAYAVSDPREMLPDASQEARAEAIGSQLRCLVCQNESIEDSRADLARDLRQKVREQVTAGRTNQQVIDWMVARYGNFVRLRPPFMASTFLLYATPFLGLLIGGLAAWFGRRRAMLTPEPAPLSPAEQATLRELTGKL